MKEVGGYSGRKDLRPLSVPPFPLRNEVSGTTDSDHRNSRSHTAICEVMCTRVMGEGKWFEETDKEYTIYACSKG